MIWDILARYSTDRQNPDTIEVQVNRCMDWIQRRGDAVGEIFSDYATSGMLQDRPAYSAMMEHLRAGKAGGVVIYDQSRMFRDIRHWFDFRDEVQLIGAQVSSVTQPFIGGDLQDPAVFMAEGTMAVFNHIHVLQTRQKTREKLRHLARQGKWTGGRPPLGYDVGEDKRLIINAAEACCVQAIFKMYTEGRSYKYIIGHLNRNGFRTKAGADFGNNSIAEILRNEKYVGRMVYGANPVRHGRSAKRNNHGPIAADAIVIEDGCPAIIDRDTWDAVQAMLKANCHAAGGRNHAKEVYALSGKVKCGCCGSAMVAYASGGQSKGYAYYQCNAKKRLHTGCPTKGVNTSKLDELAAKSIQRFFAAARNRDRLFAILQSERQKYLAGAAPTQERLRGELAAVNRSLNNLVEALADGAPVVPIREKMHSLTAKREQISRQLSELHTGMRNVGISLQELRQGIDALATADLSDDTARAALLAAVENITVHADHIDISVAVCKQKKTASLSADGPTQRIAYTNGAEDAAPFVCAISKYALSIRLSIPV